MDLASIPEWQAVVFKMPEEHTELAF
jgi:hypothetical protein